MKTYLRLLTLKACAKAQESLEGVVLGGGDGNCWVNVKLKINPVFTKASIASINQRERDECEYLFYSLQIEVWFRRSH